MKRVGDEFFIKDRLDYEEFQIQGFKEVINKGLARIIIGKGRSVKRNFSPSEDETYTPGIEDKCAQSQTKILSTKNFNP